jgi:hypothetical protein
MRSLGGTAKALVAIDVGSGFASQGVVGARRDALVVDIVVDALGA